MKLHSVAVAELTSAQTPRPFLSEGDILCAWWSRVAVSHQPLSGQTVVVTNVYDIRKAIREDLLPEGQPYISNAISFINVLLTVQNIVEKPLSYIAASIRSSIAGLGAHAQVESYFSLVRQNSGKLPPFVGDKNMHMVTFTNWTKANLYNLDFSPALADASPPQVAKPRHILVHQLGMTPPNCLPITGKDNQGNYLLCGHMNKGQWANIERRLASEE